MRGVDFWVYAQIPYQWCSGGGTLQIWQTVLPKERPRKKVLSDKSFCHHIYNLALMLYSFLMNHCRHLMIYHSGLMVDMPTLTKILSLFQCILTDQNDIACQPCIAGGRLETSISDGLYVSQLHDLFCNKSFQFEALWLMDNTIHIKL